MSYSVIIATIVIVCCIRKRKQHLSNLERKIQLNMDMDSTKRNVEMTNKDY